MKKILLSLLLANIFLPQIAQSDEVIITNSPVIYGIQGVPTMTPAYASAVQAVQPMAGAPIIENNLVGCNPSTPEAKEIVNLFYQWNASLSTLNSAEVAENYATNGILLPTVSNKVRHNHAEVADYFDHFLQKKPQGKLLECNVRIHGDVALNSGVYRFFLKDHGKSVTVDARYTYVYKKQPTGKWLIIDHHSSAMPEKAGAKSH